MDIILPLFDPSPRPGQFLYLWVWTRTDISRPEFLINSYFKNVLYCCYKFWRFNSDFSILWKIQHNFWALNCELLPNFLHTLNVVSESKDLWHYQTSCDDGNKLVKFRFSKKATISHMIWCLLSKFQIKWGIASNFFVAFSECPNLRRRNYDLKNV